MSGMASGTGRRADVRRAGRRPRGRPRGAAAARLPGERRDVGRRRARAARGRAAHDRAGPARLLPRRPAGRRRRATRCTGWWPTRSACSTRTGWARAHVLGHDWGAAVGWNLAGRHPDRVATLTAVSVPHPAAHAAALRDDADQQRRSGYIAVFRRPDAEDLLLADGRPPAAGDVRPGRRAEAFVRAAHRAGRADRPAELVPGDVPARPRRARPGHGARPRTSGAPTDLAVGRAAAEDCANHVAADYRFVELPGVSHWVPEQEPDTVARLALERISPGR